MVRINTHPTIKIKKGVYDFLVSKKMIKEESFSSILERLLKEQGYKIKK